MQVKGSQVLYRLPGRVGRYDHLLDGVSGRAGHFSTLELPRSCWAAVIQARSWHHQSISLGDPVSGEFLAPPGPQLWKLSAVPGSQAHPGVQVVLASGVWVTIVSAGDMGGAGLCSSHISPSSLLLLKWKSRWEVLGKWES